MKYDVRVVAALALCVLALPPVVNAIMAQAAQQADTSWLRDADFDGDPEIDDPPPVDFQPPPGRDPPPEAPPPEEPRDRPEPVCQPIAREQPTTLRDDISDPTGSITLVLEGRDRGVQAFINGTGVTGSPQFSLDVDGTAVWTYTGGGHLNANVRAEPDEAEMADARAPEEWTLTWNLRGVIYDRFDLSLITVRCEVPPDGR